MFELLTTELTTVMQLAGTPAVSDISVDHVVDRGFAARPSIDAAPYILGESDASVGSESNLKQLVAVQEATIAGLRAEVASLKAALVGAARL